jgi:raffinose/stachyose/melibiose transport system permease protein
VPVTDVRPVARRGRPGEPRRIAYAYVAPALLVFAVFLLFPLLRSVWLSLYEWDGLGVGTWVGLGNYADVLTEPDLRRPFLNSLLLIVFFSFIPVTLGLALAGLMARHPLRGMGFFRSVIFLPQVVALVVVGVAWRAIFVPDGELNQLLRAVGLDSWTRGWLGDDRYALVTVGIVGVWVGTGLCVVLFLAGLAKVPRELYEAARLDGAGPVREFLAVGLPALRGEIAVALTLTVVAALRTFDLVYVMIGSTGTGSRVPSFEVYDRAMLKGQVGTGVTIALLLTVVILCFTVLINRLSERAEP